MRLEGLGQLKKIQNKESRLKTENIITKFYDKCNRFLNDIHPLELVDSKHTALMKSVIMTALWLEGFW
jgi:hypothetical protein